MSYKKIVVPLSVPGIQKIQDELKEYKRWQKDKAKELAERLAMLGASVASIRFSRAAYTGMRDATVSVVAIPNGYAVKADMVISPNVRFFGHISELQMRMPSLNGYPKESITLTNGAKEKSATGQN